MGRADRRLLVVDDDPRLATHLARDLRRDGFDVAMATTAERTIAALERLRPDLLIVDPALPGQDPEHFLGFLADRSEAAILVLSSAAVRGGTDDPLRSHGDGYLRKPFRYDELRRRVERLIARADADAGAREVVLGPGVSLDLAHRRLRRSGEAVTLTPTETRFLEVLLERGSQPTTTEALLASVWPDVEGADPAYVWVAVRRLRRKLEPDPAHPRYLVSEAGEGYRLRIANGGSG